MLLIALHVAVVIGFGVALARMPRPFRTSFVFEVLPPVKADVVLPQIIRELN